MERFRAEGNARREHVLSDSYVHFWRWATWKVFDAHPEQPSGIVAFITPSSYTTGQGYAGMREYLRRTADEGWIIDLSPEGHRPSVGTRVFPGVQAARCASASSFATDLATLTIPPRSTTFPSTAPRREARPPGTAATR